MVLLVASAIGSGCDEGSLEAGTGRAQLEPFVDDFEARDDERWYWRLDGAGQNQLTEAGVRFLLPAGTSAEARSNAEIYDAGAEPPHAGASVAMRLRTDHLQAGTRGWGFWNTSGPESSEMAWFAYVDGGPTYPLRGFFAVTQARGRFPRFSPLDLSYLDGWHEYQIWQGAGGVRFTIDDQLVAEHDDNVPSRETPMRVHVWVDNVIYDLITYEPAGFAEIPVETSVEIDWLRLGPAQQ